MKRSLMYVGMVAMLATTTMSCKKSDDGGGTPTVVASPVASLTWSDGTDMEAYTFTYDASKRVSNILDVYDGDTENADNIMYDYSTAGQLTITKGGHATLYKLDASGRVITEVDSDTESYTFTYNSDGYLISTAHVENGVTMKQSDMTVVNGNTTQIVSYNDDGSVDRTKTFSYTSGDNVNALQQDNILDSNWKSTAGLFGKPNKKLIDYAEYWHPGEENDKGKTTYTYTFDTKNRPSVVTKTGDGFSESVTLTY